MLLRERLDPNHLFLKASVAELENVPRAEEEAEGSTGGADGATGLKRTLGTRDLVLFNLVAIIGLRWINTAAKSGP